jgi:hypothetical protein
MAAAATLLLRAYGWTPGVKALYALSLLLLLAGLAFPGVLRRAERLGDRIGKAVGAALTWALLAPLYLLVFAPARLALGLSGRDPLRRRFPAPGDSYWVAPSPADAGRDRRQF